MKIALLTTVGYMVTQWVVALIAHCIYNNNTPQGADPNDEALQLKLYKRYRSRAILEGIWTFVCLAYMVFLAVWSIFGMVYLQKNSKSGWFGFSVICLDILMFLGSLPAFIIPFFCCCCGFAVIAHMCDSFKDDAEGDAAEEPDKQKKAVTGLFSATSLSPSKIIPFQKPIFSKEKQLVTIN